MRGKRRKKREERDGWPTLLRLGTVPLELQEGRGVGMKGGREGWMAYSTAARNYTSRTALSLP